MARGRKVPAWVLALGAAMAAALLHQCIAARAVLSSQANNDLSGLQSEEMQALGAFRRHKRAEFDLYVWAGPREWDKGYNDTLVVFRVNTQRRTRKLLWKVHTGNVGNEPHHMGFSGDRSFLICGGLLSFARGLPSLYFFHTSKVHRPRLVKAETPPNSTAADIGISLPNGNVLLSMMGGPGGGNGGQLVEYDRHMRLVRQFPKNPEALLKETGSAFQPHGLTVSNDGRYIFSSDFIEPISTVVPPVKKYGSVRMFDAKTRKLLRTYAASTESNNSMGAMDVCWIKTCAIATCTATGKLYCADPRRKVLTVSYDFKDSNAQPQIIVTNRAQDTIWVAAYGQDAVYKLDATNPYKLKLLRKLQLPKGAMPHSIVLSPDETMIMITDYFLDETPVKGVIVGPGDKFLRFVDARTMKEIKHMRVDFNTAVHRGMVYQPHGMAILE